MNRLLYSLCVSAVGCAFVLQSPAAAVANSKETILHFFGSGTDGEYPAGSLIDVKRILYGTTELGGTYGDGTVFSMNPKTGAETVVYSFLGGTDGEGAAGSPIDVNGTLYGLTAAGGGGAYCSNNDGCGTVFALDASTGAETVLYSFCGQQNCADGEYPHGGVIDVNGILYGTTNVGGDGTCTGFIFFGCGIVFSVDPKTGAETVVYSFQNNDTDGEFPNDGLINVHGVLYGTTSGGGANGGGTVFSVDPNTGMENAIYSFCSRGTKGNCKDGSGPDAGLIEVKGALYGTTGGGGAHCSGSGGCGTIFSVNPKTGAETVVYSFLGGTDGRGPDAKPVDVDGTLYGTTYQGGGHRSCVLGCGTVFSINLNTGAETVIHSFGKGTDGAQPSAGLIDVKGALYGTTPRGGKYCTSNYPPGCGTVFAITP